MKWLAGILAAAGLSGCIVVPVGPPHHGYAHAPSRAVVVAPAYPVDRGYRDDRQRGRYP